MLVGTYDSGMAQGAAQSSQAACSGTTLRCHVSAGWGAVVGEKEAAQVPAQERGERAPGTRPAVRGFGPVCCGPFATPAATTDATPSQCQEHPLCADGRPAPEHGEGVIINTHTPHPSQAHCMHDCMRYAPAARNARVTSFSFRLIDAGSGGWATDTVSRSTRPTPTD